MGDKSNHLLRVIYAEINKIQLISNVWEVSYDSSKLLDFLFMDRRLQI